MKSRSPQLLFFLIILLTSTSAQGQSAPAEVSCSGGDFVVGDVTIYDDAIGLVNEAFVPLDFGSLLLDLVSTTHGDLDSAAGMHDAADVIGTDGGAVHAASGELRHAVELYRIPGFVAGRASVLAMQYRSFQVDDWRGSTNDPVATIEDPFGPGWRASWGDRLIIPATPGDDVVRIDGTGAEMHHPLISTESASFPLHPGVVFEDRIYGGIDGSRIALRHRIHDGDIQAFWIRESADLTTVEYITTGEERHLRPSRTYLGDPNEPDAETRFEWDSEPGAPDLEPHDTEPQTQSGGPSLPCLAPVGHFGLTAITDHRGIRIQLHWTPVGPGIWRVTKISVSHPTWTYDWSRLTRNFSYSSSFPHRLQKVVAPRRDFIEDVNRDGDYDLATELFAQTNPCVLFEYHSSSSRIRRISDLSTGTTRQWGEYTYDTVIPWRVATQQTGIPGPAPVGQAQRLQQFTYPNGALTWTDARGVVRTYIRTTAASASPTRWRVTTIHQDRGPTDPRPADPRNYVRLTWQFGWDTSGSLDTAIMPSGLIYDFTWDADGRGLPVKVNTIPTDGSAPLTRSWTWRSWNDSDRRLASRIAGFVDADGIGGSVTYVPDSQGITATIFKNGTLLYRVRQDADRRVRWHEEAPFQVDGGGTSTRRTTYSFGTIPAKPDYRLINKVSIGDGTTVEAAACYDFEGPGFNVLEIDALGRKTAYVRSVTGQVTCKTPPMTPSGVGAGQYTPKVEFFYTLRGDLGIHRVPAYDGNGSLYAHGVIERRKVYDFFGRIWKVWRDRTALNDPGPTQWDILTWAWDSADRLMSVTGLRGDEVSYVYDDHDRPYRRIRRLDTQTVASRTYWFDPDGEHQEVLDETGTPLSFVRDPYGRVAEQHEPGNVVFRWNRDQEGRVLAEEYRTSGVLRQTKHFDRDLLGRIEFERISTPGNPLEMKTTFTWSGVDRVVREVDESGRSRSYFYDTLGRDRRWSDDTDGPGTGNQEVTIFDAVGNLVEAREVFREDDGGIVTARTLKEVRHYDDWDRLIRQDQYHDTQVVQSQKFSGYNSLNHPIWTKDQEGVVHESSTDALGRAVDVTIHARSGTGGQPFTQQTTWNDSPADPNRSQIVTVTDGEGRSSEFHYDLGFRLVERRLPGWSISPRRLVWTYAYDDTDEVVGWIDGNGTGVQVDRDAEGRLRRMWVPLATAGLSTLTTEQDFTYDDLGRPQTSRVWWNEFGTAAGPGANALLLNQLEWVEDEFSRVQSATYGFLDDGSHHPVVTKTVSSTWGTNGSDFDTRRSITSPAGFLTTLTPDADGRVARMDIAGPGLVVQDFARLSHIGENITRIDTRVDGTSANRLTTRRTYDGTGRLSRIQSTYGPGLDTDPLRYSLDVDRSASGNVSRLVYAKQDGSAGDWIRPDDFGRQQEWKLGVSAADFLSGNYTSAGFSRRKSFDYDRAHNRTASVDEIAGSAPVSTTYSLEPNTNQYDKVGAQIILHDGNGNLVFDGKYVYKYDFLDRLCEVSCWNAATQTLDPVTYYGHDATNHRVLEINSAGVTWSVWDDRHILEQYDGSFAAVRTWFNGTGSDTHLGYAAKQGNGWRLYAYIQGHQDNVTKVVDSNGAVVEHYEYDPFGRRDVFDASGQKLTDTAIGNPFGFTGRYHDRDTSLVYYRNRTLHTGFGQWLTLDPIGIWGDHMEWGNGKAYVANRPGTATDPDGEIISAACLARAGRAARGGPGRRPGGRRPGRRPGGRPGRGANGGSRPGNGTERGTSRGTSRGPSRGPDRGTGRGGGRGPDRGPSRGSGRGTDRGGDQGGSSGGAAAGSGGGKTPSNKPGRGREPEPKVVELSKSKYPEATKHLEDSGWVGKPLTVDRPGTKKRRRESMKGTKTQKGKDRDECPPAVFKEGGKGASVRHIDPSDNRGAGATIGNALKKQGVKDGEVVIIKIVK